jgi:hypothetical protein
MRIALPLASTSYLGQANVDAMQGLQEVQQMDRAQVQVQGLQLLHCCRPAFVVMQLLKQRVQLQLEEVKVKKHA